MFTIDWLIDNKMLKINVVKNDSTIKPSTKWAHKSIIPALITSKNNPKLKIVTGKVKSTKIGFKKMFNKPKTTAIIIDVVKLATLIPSIK